MTVAKPEGTKTKSAETDEQEQAAGEEKPKTRIWNKYKDLAAGKAGDEPEDETTEAEEEPAITPKKTAKAAENENKAEEIPEKEANPRSLGFSSLIDRYQESKKQRSQLRTMSVSTPEDLERHEMKKAKSTPELETSADETEIPVEE
jgi:hypothetical protein